MKLGKRHFSNLRSSSYWQPDQAVVTISAEEIVIATGFSGQRIGKHSLCVEGLWLFVGVLSIAVEEMT